MNKYTSIWVLLVVIATALSYVIIAGHYQTHNEHGATIFIQSVKGCAETENGTATRGLGIGKEEPPKVEVVNNSIIYSRAINHLCCRKVSLEYEMNKSNVNIYEVWSGSGCKCICFSKINATVKGLNPGSYLVNVYETGTKPGTNEPMKQKLVTSEQVTIASNKNTF